MAKSKATSKVKKTKSEVAKTIRGDILQSKDMPATDEPTQSVSTAQNVAAVAAAIEIMSDSQEEVLLDILKALENIPKNREEQEKQSQDTLEKLIKVIVKLDKQIEEATEAGDTEKATKLQGMRDTLRGEADTQQKLSLQSLNAAPKTFGETIGRAMGVEPTMMREQGGGVKGLAKSLFKGTRDYIGAVSNPGKFNQSFIPTVDEKIQKQKEEQAAKDTISSSLGESRKAEIAEKIKDVPEHLRIKVDPETGSRYRTGTKGNRINEFEESGAKNSRFEFGTLGKMVDETTGKNYDYGTAATETKATASTAARPTASSIFEGEATTDTATDTGSRDIVDKLDEVKNSIEELNTTLENKDMRGVE